MPIVTAHDRFGIAQELQKLQELEAGGKVPAGTVERRLAEMGNEYEYGGGGSSANEGYSGFFGGDSTMQAPWAETGGFSNFERRQRMADSMANDAMLRELMSYKRKRTEEDPSEGQYALARYPQLYSAMAAGRGGMGGVGQLMPGGLSPEEAREYTAGRKRWAAEQADLLGMPSPIEYGEARGFNRAAQGMGARERSGLFRQFLRG